MTAWSRFALMASGAIVGPMALHERNLLLGVVWVMLGYVYVANRVSE